MVAAVSLLGAGTLWAKNDLTLRVDDVRAQAGDVVRIEIRTYSPRPVGQGQMCFSARRLSAAQLGIGAGAQERSRLGDASALGGFPFAEFVGGAVLSAESDALVSFDLRENAGVPELEIAFSSASGSVNRADGPMVYLDFRLRDDLAVGEEYEIGIDLGATQLFGPQGEPLTVRSVPGTLTVIGNEQGGEQPGVLRFTQRTFRASEGGAGAIVTVERTLGDDGAVSVAFTTQDGSANEPDDYSASDGTLQWADGDDGVRSFVVPLLADAVIEGTETFSVLLLAPDGGAQLDATQSIATVEILDGSVAPRPTAPAELTRDVFQGLEHLGSVTFGVRRVGSLQDALTLRVRTVDGSALGGLDFTPLDAMLTFAAGEGGVRLLDLELLDDGLTEGTEDLRVQLLSTSGALLAESTVAIVDDDAPQGACVSDASTLCLQQERFQVEVVWRTPERVGRANAVPLTTSTGTFWFFSADNVEVLIKVLDACSLPSFQSYWVFFAATTNLDFTLTVTDTESGVSREYNNPAGQAALPVQDVLTFRTCS